MKAKIAGKINSTQAHPDATTTFIIHLAPDRVEGSQGKPITGELNVVLPNAILRDVKVLGPIDVWIRTPDESFDASGHVTLAPKELTALDVMFGDRCRALYHKGELPPATIEILRTLRLLPSAPADELDKAVDGVTKAKLT